MREPRRRIPLHKQKKRRSQLRRKKRREQIVQGLLSMPDSELERIANAPGGDFLHNKARDLLAKRIAIRPKKKSEVSIQRQTTVEPPLHAPVGGEYVNPDSWRD